ncbi:hypothetical protein DSL64_06120 [Dyadobacter luteus]|jgi:hypothetical protein|uniref:Secretion system C-terminal sorting domain-containing protein n=1 Tax=Dyadobacter luteus TaxID=2259619 RepID=A0A3D8YF30_9BACT|nr:T9SS type A sorting domain-containing protein [Dyadobacter luteus]REA63188.1 hypothetical protein DSL64_06120 [Dyadobacter luteus]
MTIMSFGGKRAGSVLKLEWATAAEVNNKGFDVERSEDSKVWSAIGFVQGKNADGNSAGKLEYQFTDEVPLQGNSYYRLRQTDWDAKGTYSRISYIPDADFGAEIVVYPNPATQSARVKGLTGTERIWVYNIQGKGKYLIVLQSSNGKSISRHLLKR